MSVWAVMQALTQKSAQQYKDSLIASIGNHPSTLDMAQWSLPETSLSNVHQNIPISRPAMFGIFF